VREARQNFYLQIIKNPDAPATLIDVETMPWAELQGLLLAYIRHRYTDYEARLAAGEDRETLQEEIRLASFRAYPWLNRDPRPFPARNRRN
jgi:hypothetical protein